MVEEGLAGYLVRLGVAEPGPPSVPALQRLQRAHLERVPYENLDIQLGRAPSLEPIALAGRFATGRGGYCFQLNLAFGALLESLGYDVTRHMAGIHRGPGTRGVTGDHVTLVVRVDGAVHLVDVGLGDGPYDPLPLRPGRYTAGGFAYGVERSACEPGGWTFRHHPGSSFSAMEISAQPAARSAWAAGHQRLSGDPRSPYRRTFVMSRRDAEGMDLLRGRILARIGAERATELEITSADEWFDVIARVFGRPLDDVSPAARHSLWSRVTRAHDAWAAQR
ncbi:arylamine N-acetyltransferase family protein [Streptomyces sp. NPDC054865]